MGGRCCAWRGLGSATRWPRASPSIFIRASSRPRYAAVTAVAHIGVHLWQTDDGPTYELAVPRGFALSFWHWLEASSAEYGLELVTRIEPAATQS